MRGRVSRTKRRSVLSGAAGLSAVALTGLAGCLSSSEDSDGVEMTIASSFDPNHIIVEAAELFKEEIEMQTDDDFSVNVSGGGAYGAEDEISELVSTGEPEAHAAGTFPYFQYTYEYYFVGSPFVLDDYDQFLRVMDADITDGMIDELIESGNQRPVGQQIYRGGRHLTANVPVETPEDLQGITLRLPELDPVVSIWDGLGANPTPIALDELYSALQTGTVDSSEGDVDQISSFNLQEVQSHLILTNHLVETGNIFINEDFYQRLDKSYQELVVEVGENITAEATQVAQEREQELFDELIEDEMTIIDDVNRDAYQAAAEPTIEQWFEDEWVGNWNEIRSI